MSDISCAICPFWTNNYCHHVSNATDSAVSPTWWCSEHPLAPGQRDRIAEMAMTGIVYGMAESWTPIRLAKDAYNIADAIIAERAKGKP